MKVCGYNKYSNLAEKSNKQDSCGEPFICPPCDSHLNISSLLSFSACSDHTIWITNEGQGYAVGDNEDGRILGTHKKDIIKESQRLELKDKEGRLCQLISAVCGRYYTLYLFSSSSSKNNQLAYVHKDHISGTPVFVNINGHNPIHLFGGYYTAAAVDREGSIFYITHGDMISGRENIEKSVLPQSEKPVSIACCEEFVIASGSSGRVFCANVPSDSEVGGKLTFEIVKELEGKEIIEVSGTYDHCLAVCKDGRVFVRGSDSFGFGCLGLGLGPRVGLGIGLGLGGRSSASEFTEISGLKHKIISASAGSNHSLFITSEGKVLTCGDNSHGELLTTESGSNICTPTETTIRGGASFCIAGRCISVVFVGTEPPANTPNRRIKDKVTDRTNDEILRQQEEIASLKEESSKQKEEICRLKEENARQKEEIARLRDQVSSTSPPAAPTVGLKLLDASTIESLDRCEEVGSGGFCRVYKVYKKEAYALKEMNVSESVQRNFGYFVGECELLCMLDHPNIEKTHGIFMGNVDRRPCMLLEFCVGNLETAVKKKILGSVESGFCLYQIAEGMKYVHSRGIIHRDLKPSNILFGSDGMIKIGDFGISRLMTTEEQSSMTRGVGTQKFMAPEIINEDKFYDEKVDVYSFGVVALFLLNGGDISSIKIGDIFKGKKVDLPSSLSASANDLINCCLSIEAKDRPSFSEIVLNIEKNSCNLVSLKKQSEKQRLTRMINEHKAKIPRYDTSPKNTSPTKGKQSKLPPLTKK